MLHKDVLLQLIPVELGGVHQDYCAAAGAALDRVKTALDALPLEMHPATSTLLLQRWEALLDIVPAEGATVSERQAAAAARWIRKGDIKKPWFVQLAAGMGYTIRIEEYQEALADWLCADDDLWEEPWNDFTAAVAGAGDTLGYEDTVLPFIWEVVVEAQPAVAPIPGLEAVLLDLAPAHIKLHFRYL